jgi:hypothetical protein
MPKMLVIDGCLVNYSDDRGGVAHAQGEYIDVPKDIAKVLANHSRALYVKKEDDHDKSGCFTASKRLLDAADKMNKPAKETAAEKKAREERELAASQNGDTTNKTSGDEGSGD